MSDLSESDLSEACRAIHQAMVLLEHAYCITSYQAFRELPELSQVTYLALAYERLLDAHWVLDGPTSKRKKSPDDQPAKMMSKWGWDE